MIRGLSPGDKRSHMLKRCILISILTALVIGAFVQPASAQGESWSVGGGYFTLPNVDTQDGTIKSSGMYACAQMRSPTYVMEVDYGIDDPGFLVVAADYLYPLSASESYGGSSFLGAGYTYFSSDTLDNQQGFNVMAGMEFGTGLQGSIRYDFLGGDQEMVTVGITYMFQ
jgi:hypothetical protein